MAPMAIAIVGFVVGAASSDTGARYFAMFLMIIGGHGSNAVTIAWASKTMIRPRVKRAAMVAFVNAFGNCAQVRIASFYSRLSFSHLASSLDHQPQKRSVLPGVDHRLTIYYTDLRIVFLPSARCSTLRACHECELRFCSRRHLARNIDASRVVTSESEDCTGSRCRCSGRYKSSSRRHRASWRSILGPQLRGSSGRLQVHSLRG